jgi:GGDEF domain-containing protein
MLKKQSQLQQSVRTAVRLPCAPTLGEVDQFFAESMRQVGVKLKLCWSNDEKTTDFLLSVVLPNKNALARWEFYEGTDKNATPLWGYVTSDILLVFNLIASSMRAVEQRTALSGRRVKVLDAYKNVYQIPDAYYRSALDLLAQDQQKLAIMSGLGRKQQPLGNVWTGDLAFIEVSSLLTSIISANMTGRLRISHPLGEGEIYFSKGLPVHARSGSLQGDECLLSMMLCREGDFRFEPDISADKQTIRQTPEILMLKGVLLRDKSQFLLNAGMKPDSIVKRKREDLAEAEFEAVSSSMASGSHLSFSMLAQKQYYLAIDNKSTVSELAEKLRLTDSQWIPLLCRMLKCDFVEVVNPDSSSIEPELEPKLIDRQAIHSVLMSLRRAETGMFTYPAFLYFLEQEHIKHFRSGRPLSVAIIEMRISGGDYEYRSPLPAQALAEAVRRISSIKRDVDLLAHYEIFDVSIVLPDTNGEGARVFCKRIVEALREKPLTDEAGTETFISVGTATIPDHAADMGLMLAAAEAARNDAQKLRDAVVSYDDLNRTKKAPAARR